MASLASAVRDIRKTAGRDNLAVVAARSVPVTRSQPLPLPTPPNSISPALLPQGLKAQLERAKLETVDSDLDLHDAHDDQASGDTTTGLVLAGLNSPPPDSAGQISAAMLAKFHLPEILLNHGPLAIRHIMGYLTTSVPGFASVAPAKARRIVVGALEGRGSGGEGGGIDGDVEFEKVGWGRWDARRRGQPLRDLCTIQVLDVDSPYLSGIPIASQAGYSNERSRPGPRASSNGDSLAFSHEDQDLNVMAALADTMSMDGSESASCSEAPDEDVVMGDDPDDATDDEDWAAVGAAALRAASYSRSAASQPGFLAARNNNSNGAAGFRSMSYSMGMTRPPQLKRVITTDAQEREAVEALLRLGSL